MADNRLAAGFWVAAYRRRLQGLEIPAFVVAHGDERAGAVLVKLNTLDGMARLFERRYDLARDCYQWGIACEGEEREVDGFVTRARLSDPDLWVIEVEDRAGRHLLDQPGLA